MIKAFYNFFLGLNTLIILYIVVRYTVLTRVYCCVDLAVSYSGLNLYTREGSWLYEVLAFALKAFSVN